MRQVNGVAAPKSVYIHGAHRSRSQRRALKRASGLVVVRRLWASELSAVALISRLFRGARFRFSGPKTPPLSTSNRRTSSLQISAQEPTWCLARSRLFLISMLPRRRGTMPWTGSLYLNASTYAPRVGCVRYPAGVELSRQPSNSSLRLSTLNYIFLRTYFTPSPAYPY